MSDEFTPFRKPSPEEERLISALVARSTGLRLAPDWMEHLRVSHMTDGGMGSLRLSMSRRQEFGRELGRVAAELQFTDADGVEVLASLNTDRDDDLFELDIWKTDFSPLRRVPGSLGT